MAGGFEHEQMYRQLCCAAVGFPTLSGWMEVGVHFVLNYSAHKHRGAAWKHMSLCLGIIDMQAGKYLLAHLSCLFQSC